MVFKFKFKVDEIESEIKICHNLFYVLACGRIFSLSLIKMNRPYCQDCGVFFQNETSFNLHMGGKVHAKQLRRNADLIKRGLQPDSMFCNNLQTAIRASVPVVTP